MTWDLNVKAEEDMRGTKVPIEQPQAGVQFDGHSCNATKLEHTESTVILLLSRIARLHRVDLSIYAQSSDLESEVSCAELLFSLQQPVLLQPVFLLLKCECVLWRLPAALGSATSQGPWSRVWGHLCVTCSRRIFLSAHFEVSDRWSL